MRRLVARRANFELRSHSNAFIFSVLMQTLELRVVVVVLLVTRFVMWHAVDIIYAPIHIYGHDQK